MSKRQTRRFAALVALVALVGCATQPTPAPVACPACAPCATCAPCPSCPAVPPPTPAAPPAKPLQPASWQDLPGWGNDDLRVAWPAFQQSCRGVASKPHGPQWKRVCELSATVDGKQANAIRSFFEANFRPYALTAPDGNTNGLITGYYEPLIKGSRTRTRLFQTPVYGVPDDLLTIDLGDVYPELKHLRLRGRLQGNKVVPYATRAEIAGQETKYASKTLFWVDDAVEFFFLQVQGSGRLKLPDGGMVRLAYADQNGHPYQSIGRLLVERGDLKLEEASMQGIQAWGRANPTRLPELLNANPSYVFFKELPVNGNDGPAGALGVPLLAERSIAVDPRYVPLGAPVFLATTRPASAQPMQRLMLAQDTGGAIKGQVRADFFWGFGPKAGEQAGRMRQNGQLWVLLPEEAAPK